MDFSDESDFYGDEETVSVLESRVGMFDVHEWWERHNEMQTALKLQADKQARWDTSNLHNPYAGVPYAWQLTETVDNFLDRLPPATTKVTPESPWIYICNPFINRKRKLEAQNQKLRDNEDEAPEEEGTDLMRLCDGGMARLDMVSEFVDMLNKSRKPQAYVTREKNQAAMEATADILLLAQSCRVRCGKWMLFCPVTAVNEIWGIVARATANNELGIAAKVAPRNDCDRRTERLICVYTADFNDQADVRRVAQKLKELGLIRMHGKPIYYKPDAFTYLGIAGGNPWGIRPSIYDSTSMIGRT